MRSEPSPHVKRVKSLRPVESRGFPPGTPVSSHRESRQGGLGDTGPQQLAHAVVVSLPCGEVI